MKYALLLSALLLTACDQAPIPSAQSATVEDTVALGPDGCNIDTRSNLVTEHKVGPVQNLAREEYELGAKNECTVRFDMTVDGEVYHFEQTEVGLEQMASICYYAQERARKNFLLDLGGTFKSESNITCRHSDKIGKSNS